MCVSPLVNCLPCCTVQVVLILSGNLSFLNWLTILPAIFCFDDRSLQWLFSSSSRNRVIRLQQEDKAGAARPLGGFSVFHSIPRPLGGFSVFHSVPRSVGGFSLLYSIPRSVGGLSVLHSVPRSLGRLGVLHSVPRSLGRLGVLHNVPRIWVCSVYSIPYLDLEVCSVYSIPY